MGFDEQNVWEDDEEGKFRVHFPHVTGMGDKPRHPLPEDPAGSQRGAKRGRSDGATQYWRDCRYCSAQIILRRRADGSWAPFDRADPEQLHRCLRMPADGFGMAFEIPDGVDLGDLVGIPDRPQARQVRTGSKNKSKAPTRSIKSATPPTTSVGQEPSRQRGASGQVSVPMAAANNHPAGSDLPGQPPAGENHPRIADATEHSTLPLIVFVVVLTAIALLVLTQL